MTRTPLHLLLVDNDASARHRLSTTLHQEGVCVAEAADAGQAFELLTGGRFDVILLDLSVQGREGGNLIAQLRIMAPKTPYVVMSAPAPGDNAIDTVLEGAAAYVTKPVLPSDLHWLLARATGRVSAASNRHEFWKSASSETPGA